MKFSILTAALLMALLGMGCGGVSASHSVSPATFFVPGLMQVRPATTDLIVSSAPTPDNAPAPRSN